MIAAGGCQSDGQTPPTVMKEVPAGSFVREWQNDLTANARGEIDRIHLLGDSLVVMTDRNQAFVFDTLEGTIRFSRAVARPEEQLLPPVRINDLFGFPLRGTINVYNRSGQLVKETTIGRALNSPPFAQEELLFAGTITGSQGRLSTIAPLKRYRNIINDVAIGLIESRPVFFDGITYAGTVEGRVYAIASGRDAAWATPGYFQAGDSIRAALKADSFALYVASLDSKLYALDRATGRIRWQYFGQGALDTPPFIADQYVYQMLSGDRLAAIRKRGPSNLREAEWEADGVQQVVAAGEDYVYVVLTNGRLAGLDVETGQVAFTTQREDLVLFAENEQDDSIYAVTRDGRVMSIRPQLKRGGFGEIVRADLKPSLPVVR